MTGFLQVQIAPRRLRAVELAANAALRRAGPPYRRWVVYVEAPANADPFVRLVDRAELKPVARQVCDDPKHGGEIPEFVFWDGEKTADLYWITPPEGTW